MHPMPAPACELRLRLTTHIRFCLGLDMSGSRGRFFLMASACDLVSWLRCLAGPPGMVKVLTPFFLLVVASLKVGVLLTVSRETHAFIPPNYDVIKPRFETMTSSPSNLIGCQGDLIGY